MAKKRKVLRVKPNSECVTEAIKLCGRLGDIVKASKKALVVKLHKRAKPNRVIAYLYVHRTIIISAEQIKKPR